VPESEFFRDVKVSKPWIAVKKIGGWHLFDPLLKNHKPVLFDSISFKGPYAVGRYNRNDTVYVYFHPGVFLKFNNVKLDFIPGKDSVSFLLVDEGDKRSIYNADGLKLFSGPYDNIAYAGKDIFIVFKKEKRGLVASDGKFLLPLAYDAIGEIVNNTISLLKGMKFGLYNILSRKLIKPEFDKNLSLYNDTTIVAFKDGFYGFIDWENKKKDTFEFNEIRHWNNAEAWVKKNSQWILYTIYTKNFLLKGVKEYTLIKDKQGEKIAIILHDTKYGVINNKNRIVLPAEFTDIKNLGDAENPLYFTEKHVEEASLFVVTYYDKDGKQLKRIVVDEQDYERIYCKE
jgi:hypothetical protein